jgi:hypothetical protein
LLYVKKSSLVEPSDVLNDGGWLFAAWNNIEWMLKLNVENIIKITTMNRT